MEKILIVEDELIVARDLRRILHRNGHKVTGVASSVEKAMTFILEERPTLVLLDIFLKGKDTGIDLAYVLKRENIPFIYVSANSSQQVLEAAKSTNPYGFIVKPFREKDLLVTIDIARYRFEQYKQVGSKSSDSPVVASANNGSFQQPTMARSSDAKTRHNMVGQSASMLKVFNLIQQVAPFDSAVLLLGESGTGKEGVSNAIVQQSGRSHRPFIKINCAAVPEGLIEAELFGFVKGSFTGATENRAGKFELAAGGTILLDEIGEMPVTMQAKLLRVLQEKELQRVGSSTTIKADVRIIAATSKNLEQEIAAGNFRLDLYYRLNVFPIVLPPLRERKEDIPLLVNHFIQYYSAKMGKRIGPVTVSIMDKLVQYEWPGNVRELQHLMERSVLLATAGTIDELPMPAAKDTSAVSSATPISVKENEKAYILSILKQCNFRVAGKGGAAELLDLPPTTLFSKIKKLGITKS
jgi:DNA-binding NtrC family response regulator